MSATVQNGDGGGGGGGSLVMSVIQIYKFVIQ